MGDRHGGRFARRGRTLNPPRPHVDAHRGVGFRWRATVFRCRGAVDRICPAQEYAPRRRPPDTAHELKDLCRGGTLSSAKASRHGARAKGFVPRRNTPLGEGLPTRREGEGICPAQERSPRRRPPDTAHEQKDLPAQELAPRRRPPDTAHEPKDLPRGVRPRPTCRRTAGRPRPTDSRKTPLRRGRTHSTRPLPSSFTEKK